MMKLHLTLGIRLNRLSLLALCVLSLFGNPISARASSGVVASPPAPVQLPPGPPAPQHGDGEGYSVAGSSRFLVIGRPGRSAEINGTTVGSVGQVLVWELDESYLVDDLVKKRFWLIDMPQPKTNHIFGGAVAAGDRWIAVAQGSFRVGLAAENANTRANRVRLFEFPPDGGWLPGPVLPDPADSAYFKGNWDFGIALAMHRNRLVVGSNNGALVYEVDPAGVWTRTQIITNQGPALTGFGSFGTVVAIREDLLVIGSPESPESDGNGLVKAQGEAIVYRRAPNGLYVIEKELRAISGVTNEFFGSSAAIEVRDGVEWIAIGAPGKKAQLGPNGFQPNAGSAHLFRRVLPGGEWTFHQEITNSFNGELTQQGRSGITIALSNGRLAVGAQSSGGQLFPRPGGRVGFHYYDKERDFWVRTGDQDGSQNQQYGRGLHGFEHGFLIGTPGYPVGGDWEWRPTDPYVAFLNNGAGPSVVGTTAQDRRGDADPDGDGIINTDEFFFGTPPLEANPNPPMALVFDDAARQFKFQWQQAADTFGLSAKIAWSTNLIGGNWVTNGLQVVSLGAATNSTARRFEARLPAPVRTEVFFRLLVE